VDRSIALGSDLGAGQETTSTASALILLNGATGEVLGENFISGRNIRTDLRTPANVTDVFAWDTSKDTDGGLWRNDDRAKASSWYNETIDNIATSCVMDTDDRCGSRDFPAKAIIVAGTTKLYIFDAERNTVWMEFAKNASSYMIGIVTNSTGSSVWAQDGKVYYGTNGAAAEGLFVIDFINDRAYKYDATNDYEGDKSIANRNSAMTWTAGPSSPIVNAVVNDVMARTLDGKSYAVVGTDAGMSVINETDRTVYDYDDEVGAADNDYNSVFLDRDGNLWDLNETAQQLDKWTNVIADTADEDPGNPDSVWDESSTPSLFASSQTINIAPAALSLKEGTSTVDGRSPTVFVGHNGGLTVVNTKANDETNGTVKYYSNSYITEEMIGDIRGMWPLTESAGGNGAITDRSVKAGKLTNKGSETFSVSAVRGTGITFAQATSDYLCSETGVADGTCDDDANFDTTTGNITVGAWIKRSASGTDVDTILAKWGNADADQAFRLSFSALDLPIFQTTDGAGSTVTSAGTAITDTNWHHLVGVFDNSNNTQYLYVDGVLADSDGQSNNTPDSSVAFTVGADLSGVANAAADFFRGTIDEPFVTAEALSAGQVRHIEEVGHRALQNHTSSRITGVTGADNYQRLMGNASGGTSTTNRVFAVATDDSNQFAYVGLNSSGDNTGGVTVIGLDSDTAVDLYDATANTAKDDDIGTQFSANDVISLAVTGAPCPAYNGGTTTCNNSATLAIAGTNDTATRVWMETSEISLYAALSQIASPTLTKNEVTVNNIFAVYNTYNNLTQSATGEQISTPAFSVDSNGNLIYNYLGTSTSATAMDLSDSILTTGTLFDLASTTISSGTLANLTANALTTGTALNVSSTGTITSGGELLSLNANSATSGNLATLVGNGLTSGSGISLSSSATGFSGNLIDVTLSGSNSNNSGSLLSLTNSGTLNTGTTLYIKHYATGTNNLAFRIDDESSDATPFVVDGTGNVGIGDSGPDYSLEISSAAAADPTFALSDGDITHGLTTLAQTDVVLHVAPLSSSAGGAQITAITESDAQALSIRGVIGSTNPTDTTPAIKLVGAKSNGTTGIADLGVGETQTANTSETLFQIANNDDTAAMTIMGNGNVAIGNNVAPLAKLTVTSNPIGASYLTGHAALIVDQYETHDAGGGQDIIAASASGTKKFWVEYDGDVQSARFVDADNTSSTFYVDPANGTTSIVVDGAIISDGAFSITSNGTNGDITINAGSGTVIIGDGTGKLNAGTIDPPYTINGTKYATYMAAMTGLKEETTGTIATGDYVVGVGYKATIDFANEPVGSDLWLFSKSTDLRRYINDLVVLLSPSGNARSWYTIDPEGFKLNIYTTKPAIVSYRLTAPRFDAHQWDNTRTTAGAGFNLDEIGLTTTSTGEVIGEDGTPLDELVIRPSSSPTTQVQFDIVDAAGSAITEVAALARATIANITAGLVTAQRVTSPIVETEELLTNLISPLGSESEGVAVQLEPDQTFGVINESNEPVATFDAAGNATLSGELTAQSVQTTSLAAEEATIAGNLFADRVQTSFGDLDTRIEELTASVAAIPSGSGGSGGTGLDATSSALLAMLLGEHIAPDSTAEDLIIDADLVARGDLSVYGDTLLGRTTIGGTLLVDSNVFIDDTGIQTAGGTLYLQQNKLGAVDILDGTMVVDLLGNVSINGNLAVSGNLTVGGVLGVNTIDLAGNTASQSASSSAFGKLAFLGAGGAEVASIDASGSASFAGNLVASGSGTFNKLFITDTPVGTPSASQATAGTGTLSRGQVEVLIPTSAVTANSLIYVTPLSATGNQVLFVKQKSAGAGFSVAIDRQVSTDIQFNWWIIN
jgi:hypothetical protein